MRYVYLAVIFVVMTTLVFTALVALEKALGRSNRRGSICDPDPGQDNC